ncbi:hypothetical protein ACFLV4_01730 [Chloroflexota bacterium]
MISILRTIVSWGWSPILITVLAIVGYRSEWQIEIIAPILVLILVIGLVMAVLGARERELELTLLRLKQLAGYFNRRFMGNSALSIFSIIDGLFAIENPQVWEWARACDIAQRIFNTWCDSFTSRLESDIRTRRFDVYRRTYLNELWLISTHYYEFIEQFYELAQKVEIPRETRDQYSRFVMEYNSFVQNFRENIAEMNKAAKTEIEPPSVKLARELSAV